MVVLCVAGADLGIPALNIGVVGGKVSVLHEEVLHREGALGALGSYSGQCQESLE